MCIRINKDTGLILLLIACSIFVTFICQAEGIFNKYVIEDDVTQYLPPVYALLGGEYYRNLLDSDLILKYMFIKDAPGHLAVFYIFGLLSDPLILVKIIPFILAAISAALLFYIGKILKNSIVGFFASFTFIFYVWTSQYAFFSGGHPKAFAFPLFFAFIYFLLSQKKTGCFITLLLQVIFYPPILAVTVPVYLFSLFKPKGVVKKDIIFFTVITLICMSLIYILYKQPNDFLGPTVTAKEMKVMPEFGPGGRDPLFNLGISGFLKSEDASGIMVSGAFPYLLLLAIIGIIYLGREIKSLPPLLFYILLSGILVFILSYIFMFNLFFPGRYLEHTLPIFMIFIIAFAMEKLLTSGITDVFKKTICVSSVCLIALVHVPYLQKNLYNFEKSFYTFIATLPEKSLIAGHPYEMDPVFTFTKRRTLVQFEVSTAWYKNYYSQIRERTRDFFSTYYTDSLKDVEDFFKKYNVDYLVVDKRHFSEGYMGSGNFYIEPFNNDIKVLVDENRGRFALMGEGINRYKVYEDPAGYFIIRMDQ
ncbi:hypothetical protein ACFL3J_01395 [Candidatus Omnitrophota bacterium]